MTYEGARSITGPYLSILGALGFIVGTVAGFAELVGYGFRLVSGLFTDKTKKYWTITFVGYIINLFAVPLLGLAGNWPFAVALMIAERFGKAIRIPSRDAMLSYATKQIGRGWGFGLHEALDQIGAILGPLIVALVLYFRNSYPLSFGVLLIPALLAISILIIARVLHPNPENLEVENLKASGNGLSKTYWIYVVAVSLVGAGYVDFPLISFHFEQRKILSDIWMPIFYAIAMGVEGLAALILGRLFDTKGLNVLIAATVISALFAPLVFFGGFTIALIGMILWGIGMGAHETIMKAFVANLVSPSKRGTAYGMLNIWFGVFWFLGSALMGYLYDISIPALVTFSITAQLLSVPLFYKVSTP